MALKVPEQLAGADQPALSAIYRLSDNSVQVYAEFTASISLWCPAGEAKPEKDAGGAEIQVTIYNEPLHEISPLLFGQFCEQTSAENPEQGADAAWDAGSGTIRSEVVAQIRKLKPGLIRFPGGTTVDYYDWTELVANVPDTRDEHLKFKFGLDAFIRVCREVGAQPLLVVNLRDGLMKLKPLAEATRQAAGLVAYCNAPVGEKLPDGMPDWTALRASNGSQQPFGVKYFQIGNESWKYDPKDVEWKLTVLEAFIDAMREVDPSIQIIADAHPDGFPQLCRRRLGERLAMVALHSYLPCDQPSIS
jgi:alpha-L-arabinofuranosidase